MNNEIYQNYYYNFENEIDLNYCIIHPPCALQIYYFSLQMITLRHAKLTEITVLIKGKTSINVYIF